MTCKELNAILIDLARGEAVSDEAAAHLRQCNRCSERRREQREVSNRLSGLATSVANLEAPAHIEVELVKSLTVLARRHRMWRPAFAWSAVAAACGVLAVLAALLAARGGSFIDDWIASRSVQIAREQGPVAAAPQREEAVGTAAVEEAARMSPVQEPLLPAAAQPEVRVDDRKVPTSPAPVTVGDAQDFLPLPNAEAMGPMTSGQIVRIRLPRSALRSIGLPVNEDHFAEQVDADIVLGDDMMARAIRFVNYTQ